MLGLPVKELKAAAVHADQTLTHVEQVLAEAQRVLTVHRQIAEDLQAITGALRAAITKER